MTPDGFVQLKVSDVWQDAIREERDGDKRFVRAQARVSSIGMCARKVIGQAVGDIDSSFPWELNEAGHTLQGNVFRRIRQRFPTAEEEVRVPTSVEGVETHPDIFIPVIDDPRWPKGFYSLGCQVKSCLKSHIDKYCQYREKLPNPYNVDQTLLEWHFWRKAGFCVTDDRKYQLDVVPDVYELLYIARDDFAMTSVSIRVDWDETRAQQLEDEFLARHEAIAFGDIPGPRQVDITGRRAPKATPADGIHWECAMDGWRGKPASVCPYYRSCWGRDFQPTDRSSYRRY